jgi:hypothetical protein
MLSIKFGAYFASRLCPLCSVRKSRYTKHFYWESDGIGHEDKLRYKIKWKLIISNENKKPKQKTLIRNKNLLHDRSYGFVVWFLEHKKVDKMNKSNGFNAIGYAIVGILWTQS